MSVRLEKQEIVRRDFLGLASMYSAGLAILAGLIGIFRLPRARVLPDPSSIFRIGVPTDFPPGTGRIIPDYRVRIMATGNGVAALSLVCTHLGCVVQETSKGFECPCHGSKFDQGGKVTGGPAPRPLRWLTISQTPDGELIVDPSTEVKPGQFYRV